MPICEMAIHEVQLSGPDSAGYWSYGGVRVPGPYQQQTTEQVLTTHPDILFKTQHTNARQQPIRCLTGISVEDVGIKNCS